MKLPYSIFLFVCTICICVNAKSIPEADVEGYYWRDYTGAIPADAFPGGKTPDGETTYIGQTLHRNAILIPGKILQSDKKMRYEFGRLEYEADNNVKILCTEHPEKLVWIKTNSKEVVSGLRDKHVVVGGSELGYRVLIGRVLVDGHLHLGKVHTIPNEYAGIHITDAGKGWQEGNFEVLGFDPSIPVEKAVDEDGSKSKKLRLTTIRGSAAAASGNYYSMVAVLLCLLHNVFVRNVV